MKRYEIDYSSDGCPNDCGYCKDNYFACVYKDPCSPLSYKPYICCVCGKKLLSSETYELKNKCYCEDCFERKVSMGKPND